MTLIELVLIVALIAAVLTAIFKFGLKVVNNIGLSFLQNFAGVLFIVSGWVKIVDPLGTAYKMHDYFEQFELTFQNSAFSFLAPLFPVLSKYSDTFAMIMIVLELVLGIMLILGHRRKLTAWLFLILVVFFTVLTGFTFLTGYVPGDVNFFDFSQWQDFDKNNMKVTDCGCFGDFIVLDPQISFMKDVFLLIPAVIFIIAWKQKHVLFSVGIRDIIIGLSTIGFIVYGLSNFVWDIPDYDFRPFSEGADIRTKRAEEMQAQANVQILSIDLKSKSDGKVITMDKDQYFKVFKEYPEEEWDIKYNYSEPAIKKTKLSDFGAYNEEGIDVTDSMLGATGSSIWIVANHLEGTFDYQVKMSYDTIFRNDTIVEGDSIRLEKVVDEVIEEEKSKVDAKWDEAYMDRYRNTIIPFINKANESGVDVHTMIGKASFDVINAFQSELNLPGNIYEADNILLKTIIRSNPGIVLLKDGKIIKKWHWKQLPNYQEAEKYLQ